MSESTPPPSTGAFVPLKPERQGAGLPPDWTTGNVTASLKRIRSAETMGGAQAQATTEAVVLLHSIRRMLLWTLVIIPTILVAFGVTLVVMASQSSSGSPTCSAYSSSWPNC